MASVLDTRGRDIQVRLRWDELPQMYILCPNCALSWEAIVSEDRSPPERKQTLRDALYHALREGPETIRELSIRIGAQEKDLVHHLEHLERSLAPMGERLGVEPARCLGCNYAFEERTRLSKPGRCPRCKSTRITLPRFFIAPK
jgi:predicted Zn-ribbon and HTH transcriptional regulator